MSSGQYTYKEISQNRKNSMLHYLHYTCACSNYIQRRAPNFFEHTVDIYNKQKGRCAVSGQPLFRPLESQKVCDTRFFVSIDRIDNKLGYEIGNIQLTSQWINHALGKKKNANGIIEFSVFMCWEKINKNMDLYVNKYNIHCDHLR